MNEYGIKIFIFLLCMGTFISPVIGSQIPISAGHLDYVENITANILFAEQIQLLNSYPLTPTEKKISSNLNQVAALKNDPLKNQNNLIKSLKTSNVYNLSNEVKDNESDPEEISDCVFVTIEVWPGNSTTFLDPYIHLPADRVEGWPRLSCWIDVSRIYEIANLSEVKFIYIPSPLETNIGSVTTEGNTILDSGVVLNHLMDLE
jgi:hypothetical protein